MNGRILFLLATAAIIGSVLAQDQDNQDLQNAPIKKVDDAVKKTNAWKEFVEFLKAAILNFRLQVKAVFRNFSQTIVQQFVDIETEWREFVKECKEGLLEKAKEHIKEIKEFVQKLREEVVAKVKQMSERQLQTLKDCIQKLKQKVVDIKQKLHQQGFKLQDNQQQQDQLDQLDQNLQNFQQVVQDAKQKQE